MTNCAMCGDCCRLIRIPHRQIGEGDEATWEPRDTAHMLWLRDGDHADGASAADMDFILANWVERTPVEGRAILPALVAVYEDFYGEGNDPGTYYTCNQFDGERNLCKVHDAQPRVCSGYPWYESPPGETSGLSRAFLRCSFWVDVPREKWPEGCDPLPSPTEEQIQQLVQIQPRKSERAARRRARQLSYRSHPSPPATTSPCEPSAEGSSISSPSPSD